MSSVAQNPMPAGVGVGLRSAHYQSMLADLPQVPWLEVHSENYFGAGGLPHHYLKLFAEHYPLSFHGVGLSLGSADGLNATHLKRLKELLTDYQPRLVSEHLSWGAIDGIYFNDLLPMPLTDESLRLFVERVDQTQSYLGRSILLENPSSYLAYQQADYAEPDFLNELCRRSGCGLLLDINNVYVSAHNLGFDALAYLQAIAGDYVGEIHLAGHAVNRYENHRVLIDDHGAPVADAVLELYVAAIQDMGSKPTLLEWDSHLPTLPGLLAEAQRISDYVDRHHAQAA